MLSIDNMYDYIVLGGGSAGCVLAARLSEDGNARVLLVERGHAMPSVTRVPAAWPTLLDSAVSWPGLTVAQDSTGVASRWPRGRGLGGSSGINGMVFIRGHRSSYDAWPDLGANGWGYDDLLPYFRKTESAPHRDPVLRGQDGPMTVAPASPAHPVAAAGLAAAAEVGHPVAEDISGGLEVGFGLPDLTIVDGRRQNAADAYLAPILDRPNLDIATNALAHRVVVRDGRAVGVEFSVGDELLSASCSGEIVLTAGAVGSAEILLRSGIGPAAHLRELGLDVVVDLPGVGENLHDHPMTGVTYRSLDRLPDSTNNHAEAFGLLSSDGRVEPDLHLVVLSVPYHLPSQPGPEHGYTIAVGLMTPTSRGSLRLSSSDPQAPPVLDPRYLAHSGDRVAMTAGLDMAREIGASPAFRPWRAEEVLPGPAVGFGSLDQYLRQSLLTYFHYVGTCRIGTDELAVVGTDLTVHGVAGLRVADASVMPSIPSANTNATVLAIAERAATLIVSD
jgi:choline dehydrogenase-like flavoprotein